MIREVIEKKAAKAIAESRYGKTKAARFSAAILDEDRLEAPDSLEDTLQDSRSKRRVLMICIGVNVVSWLSIFLIPNVVSTIAIGLELLLAKGSALLLAPAFGFTMLASFSVLRSWFPPVPKSSDDGGVMSSYEQGVDSLLTWKLWVASSALGGINAILLAVTFVWSNGG